MKVYYKSVDPTLKHTSIIYGCYVRWQNPLALIMKYDCT